MKIIVTTSNAYLHLIPIFCYLFNENWSCIQKVEIVGYDKPEFDLPSNFSFHSLGKQSDNKKDFSNDLIPYFQKQDDWFIWLFEDTFIKGLYFKELKLLQKLIHIPNTGRINLSKETIKQNHFLNNDLSNPGLKIYENTQIARYRLSTQPSIWNKKFLLEYLTPNLSPWDFESQDPKDDGWRIFGLDYAALQHNEGVTRHDIHKYDFNGIPERQLNEMKKLNII